MQGDRKEAERFFRESMQLARRGFGESDPHFAATLVNLAEFLRLQRRHQEAEPMYREVCLCSLPVGRCVQMHVCLHEPTNPLLTWLVSVMMSTAAASLHVAMRAVSKSGSWFQQLCMVCLGQAAAAAALTVTSMPA